MKIYIYGINTNINFTCCLHIFNVATRKYKITFIWLTLYFCWTALGNRIHLALKALETKTQSLLDYA